MTNKEQAIQEIKETLKRLMSFSTEPQPEAFVKKDMKCEDMELEDGSMISIEEGANLEVGTPIYKKDAEGNLSPCETGTYKLKDGRTINCKDGKVDMIEGPASVEAAPVADAKMETEVEIEAPESEEEGGSAEERIAKLEEAVSQILEMLKGMTKMQEETMNKVQEFAALPAEEPIKNSKKSADVWTKARATAKANGGELEELRNIMAKHKGDNYNSFSVNQ